MVDKKYFGCLLKQRVSNEVVPFFIFSARIKDVKQWAGIRRVEELQEGTQRVLRETRARAITKFLDSDPINTIPNNILVAFEPEVTQFTSITDEIQSCVPDADFLNGCDSQLQWGFLRFSFEEDQPEHLRPALIVDGQHRLYGMVEYEAENIPVLVVSLVGATLLEQAFQFIVVNNKIVKVPTDNVKAIIAEIDEEDLQRRLLNAGVRYGDVSPFLRDIDDLPESPFQHLLDWPHNRRGKHLVSLTMVEQSLRYLRILFPFFEEDEDSLVQIFMAMWRGVRAKYSELWGVDNKLMRKVSLNALNEFVADRLKMAWEFGLVEIFDPEAVEQQVLRMIQIPDGFWQEEWSIRIQDNANVRNLIKQDLDTITDNIRLRKHWNAGLELISEE